MDNIKTIKRPLKVRGMSQKNVATFNQIVEDTNLFIYNIYIFIEMYYVEKKINDAITCEDIHEIFKVLRDGAEHHHNKNKKFYDFYCETYQRVYFNPKKTNDRPLICGKKMDQVIKINAGDILSNITNNIQMHFSKYVIRFINCFMKSTHKQIFEYNSLIKKCSLYEFYDENDNIANLIKVLKDIKITNNEETIGILKQLETEFANKERKKKRNYMRSNENIFNDELKQVKRFEEDYNDKKKIIIKRFIKNEDVTIPNEFKKIVEHTKHILPTDKYDETLLKKSPFKFVQSMVYINNFLEQNNTKTFNVFPKRNNCVPKHIILDTEAINVIFCKNAYEDYGTNRKKIWQSVFGFPNSWFKMRGKNKRIFKGTVQTDGVSISLLYVTQEENAKNIKISQLKQNGKNIKKTTVQFDDAVKKEMIQLGDAIANLVDVRLKIKDVRLKITEMPAKSNNNMSSDLKKKLEELTNDEQKYSKISIEIYNKKLALTVEKEQYIQSNTKPATERVEPVESNKNKIKECERILKIYQSELNDLNKQLVKYTNNCKKKSSTNIEEICNSFDAITTQIKEVSIKIYNIKDDMRIIKRKNKEFWYLDDLTDSELDKLQNEKLIYCDQGKICLGYFLNGENGAFAKYTSKERKYNLHTLDHTRETNFLMKQYDITKKLETVKDINKKSTDKDKILNNIKVLNAVYADIYDKAKRKKLRKEKLEMYMDKQKTEKNMMEKIIKHMNIANYEELKTFTLIIGDWKGCNTLKNNAPTLGGISMKRILCKYFKNTYLIDEFRTSKLNNLTFTETKEHVLELQSKSKKGQLKTLSKKMHEILSFKMSNTGMRCILNHKPTAGTEIRRFIQRDKNAVLNFKTLTEHYLNNNRERIANFCRNTNTVAT